MLDVFRFHRELRILAGVSLLFVFFQIVWIGVFLSHRPDVVAPGQIDRDVTKLGGPCMGVKTWAFDKHGPIGIGQCSVRYTNTAKTHATVTLQIFVGTLSATITADAVTDGEPLASLRWYVTGGEATPWRAADGTT